MREAEDFKQECNSIAAVLCQKEDADFARETLFKHWTINDIIGHLHLWNLAADMTLKAPETFTDFITQTMEALRRGVSHQQLQKQHLGELTGQELFKAWHTYYPQIAAHFDTADPETRVQWAGPDMSTRACIIARQMEHWAHAQAIFDLFGITRKNTARLKNVAHIGVTTYSWSFKVHNMKPLLPKPYVRLTAPSGAIWEWNDPQDNNRVEGQAEDFCQIVTQCRHVSDTRIITKGKAASIWMQIAQCFAGSAETPPAPGSRYKAKG